MVQDVNRENFGLCLEPFHVAARVGEIIRSRVVFAQHAPVLP